MVTPIRSSQGTAPGSLQYALTVVLLLCVSGTRSQTPTPVPINNDPLFITSGKAAQYKFQQWIAISHVGISDHMTMEYIIGFTSATASVTAFGIPYLAVVQLEHSEAEPILTYIHVPSHLASKPKDEPEGFRVAVFSQLTMTEALYMDGPLTRDFFIFLAKRVRRNRQHTDKVKTAFDERIRFFSGTPPK